MTVRVADGDRYLGEIVAVLDESSPFNAAGGVAYVVTVSAIVSVSSVASQMTSFQ